jgi:peroxin-6
VLASTQRQIFGPPLAEASPPSLHLSLSKLVPLSSVILFALDSSSYAFASDQQDTFISRIEKGEVIIREGDTLRLNEGKWKVAMAEPVLQGAIRQGETRVIVLPPSGSEDEEFEEKQNHSQEVTSSNGHIDTTTEEDDLQDDDEDFEIDESFLANSVLTPPSHQHRFGHTPLTSPLSTSSKQRQFFPLGELSTSSTTLSQQPAQITPVALQHPIPTELLTPVPDQEEDDVLRIYLCTSDLGRIGSFSGDWATLRSNADGSARLVKVFAADGLLSTEKSVRPQG